MNAVTKLSAHLSGLTVPDEIRTIKGWVMWRMEHHEGEDKPRKVPYYSNGQRRHGRQGDPADREALVTFEAARAAAARKGMDGVGLALLPEWGLCALDFDKCIQGGELHPEVAEIAAQSYAEYSPSGSGVRVLFKGNLLNRKSFEGEFGFETFSTRGFVTVTGNALEVTELLGNENTIAEVTPEATALFARRFGKREERGAVGHSGEVLGLTPQDIERALEHLDAGMGHDQWLQVGMGLHHETRGEGFELWNAWSEGSDKYPGRDVLRHRWDSFGRNDGATVTARTLVQMANRNGAGLNTGSGPASPDEFPDEAQAQAAEHQAKVARFTPVSFADFTSRPAPTWIVKGLLPKAGMVVLYGASGAGKSFIALDVVAAVARGVPWRGLRVRQGRVVYVAAEGVGGFRNRCVAYAQSNGLQAGDLEALEIIAERPNLLTPNEGKTLGTAIGRADLVVVDTLAQVTPGANENAGEDMGKALAQCQVIHEMTGATVALVHHSGKDASKGARGWSGVRAAADAELEVERTPGGRVLRTTKQKDGDDSGEWGFELEVVSIGVDEDGDTITSCVTRETEVNKAKPMTRKLGPVAAAVNDAVQELAKVQLAGIEINAVLDLAVARLAPPEGRDTRRQVARRALNTLLEDDEWPYEREEDGTISVL